MAFRANVNIELEAVSLDELLGQIAAVGGNAKVTYSGPQNGDAPAPKPPAATRGRKAGAPEPEQSKPQVESSPAPNQQAGTSLAVGGEASPPAPTATPAPAPAPASVKAKSKEELVSELRAILTPHAQKGPTQRGEVNAFVKGFGYTLIDQIPLEALPAIVEAAREKF